MQTVFPLQAWQKYPHCAYTGMYAIREEQVPQIYICPVSLWQRAQTVRLHNSLPTGATGGEGNRENFHLGVTVKEFDELKGERAPMKN